MERLYEVRAIPEKRLIETSHDLEAAEAALESMGGGGGSGYNYVVRAPISGVIDRRSLELGAHVAAGDSLFSIVNPERVWLKMRVPAEHAAQAESATGAVFRPEGTEFTRAADEVVSVGSVIDRRTRTLPVLLAARNGDRRLKLGMYVDGRLQMGEERTGVAIPNAAIQREDGQAYAFVQTGGETFQRRSLTLGPVGETHTLVQQGLQEGEYVVTDGAYQVQLASLNADEEVQGHGHAH
jgi:RND family efflux transporter MFP subunit